MDANISFCEHHETGITHDIAIKHRISPPQSCLICAPASSRKSDQEAAATELLLGAEGAPVPWSERQILLSGGTKKGCENLLLNLREALNTSAEACNAIFVPGFQIRQREYSIKAASDWCSGRSLKESPRPLQQDRWYCIRTHTNSRAVTLRRMR